MSGRNFFQDQFSSRSSPLDAVKLWFRLETDAGETEPRSYGDNVRYLLSAAGGAEPRFANWLCIGLHQFQEEAIAEPNDRCNIVEDIFRSSVNKSFGRGVEIWEIVRNTVYNIQIFNEYLNFAYMNNRNNWNITAELPEFPCGAAMRRTVSCWTDDSLWALVGLEKPTTYIALIENIFALARKTGLVDDSFQVDPLDVSGVFAPCLWVQGTRLANSEPWIDIPVDWMHIFDTNLQELSYRSEDRREARRVRRQNREDRRRRRRIDQNSESELPTNEIELVDNDVYMPPLPAQGPLLSETYHEFFDQACAATENPIKLAQMKKIIISAYSVFDFSLEEMSAIYSGSKEIICGWLKEKQVAYTLDCSNPSEVFSLENMESVPLLFVYKHKTSNGTIQCFDIAHLHHYVSTETRNPFNREKFSLEDLQKIRSHYDFIYQIMRVNLS